MTDLFTDLLSQYDTDLLTDWLTNSRCNFVIDWLSHWETFSNWLSYHSSFEIRSFFDTVTNIWTPKRLEISLLAARRNLLHVVHYLPSFNINIRYIDQILCQFIITDLMRRNHINLGWFWDIFGFIRGNSIPFRLLSVLM